MRFGKTLIITTRQTGGSLFRTSRAQLSKDINIKPRHKKKTKPCRKTIGRISKVLKQIG